MTTLYLVRHGQASFGQRDYDALSPLGVEQARCLGTAWAAANRSLDALYCGPRRRQRETAAELRAAAAEQGLALPEPQVLDGFDEIEHGPLFAEARRLAEAGADPHELARETARLLHRWATDEVALDGLEPFARFAGRVDAAFEALVTSSARRLAIVTSSGPVACCVRRALDLGPARTVDLMLAMFNASFSTITRRDGRLVLGGFNDVGHLREPRLHTRL